MTDLEKDPELVEDEVQDEAVEVEVPELDYDSTQFNVDEDEDFEEGADLDD